MHKAILQDPSLLYELMLTDTLQHDLVGIKFELGSTAQFFLPIQELFNEKIALCGSTIEQVTGYTEKLCRNCQVS